MLTDLSRLIHLFRQSYRGRLTPQERQEFDRLLEEKHFAELDRRLHDNDYILSKIQEYNTYDHRRAFRRFRRATLGSRLYRLRYAVAGAAAAVLVAGGLLIRISDPGGRIAEKRTREQAEKILPGTKKAQLKLANGEVIAFADSAVERKVEGIGSLSSEGGDIVYTSAEKPSAEIAAAYNELSVPRGGECTFTLDDGTKVWLNSDSRLEYPVRFDGRERRVRVEGEVFFRVSHDTAHPFVVETPKMQVTVCGTSFNVRDFADEKMATTTLVTGKVDVGNTSHRVTLTPGYQALASGGNAMMNVKKVDANAVSAWTENKFVFWQQGFDEILASIARWYDIRIEYENIDPASYSLTGKIPRDCTLADVIELFEMITDASFRIEDDTLIVSRK